MARENLTDKTHMAKSDDDIRDIARLADGSFDRRAEQRPPEPWADADVADRLMRRVLSYLIEDGCLSEEQLARRCLTPQELACALPEDERLAASEQTAEALIRRLSSPENAKPYGDEMYKWMARLDRLRDQLDWPQLPSSVKQSAHRRARLMIEQAEKQDWVVHEAGASPHWRITDLGARAASDPATGRGA